jgi:hypothetical protein
MIFAYRVHEVRQMSQHGLLLQLSMVSKQLNWC